MSAVPSNSVNQVNTYNLNQLQEVISQGKIVVNGQTKYFYELLNDDSFVKNPELYHTALRCISLSKEAAANDPQKYEQLVRGYTLLNSPNVTSLEYSQTNQNARHIFDTTLNDCEREFRSDFKKFITARNQIINKPTTEIESKISNNGSQIHLRLNRLDTINKTGEELSVREWSALTQNMMRNKNEEAETTWKGIVGKVSDLLHFDKTDPKNLRSVENSLLTGEYDDVYMFNALIDGEAVIDSNKKLFGELIQDPKFLQHPQLYNLALKIIDNLKNKDELNNDEMAQLIRAYQILQTPTVTSLPERKFYQFFANQTFNNANEACENAFLKNFNTYLAARKNVFGINSWLDDFKGKDQIIVKNLKSLPNPPISQWNAIKSDIIHKNIQEAQEKWNELIKGIMNSSSVLTKEFEVKNFLLNSTAPVAVSAVEHEDEFEILNIKEDDVIEEPHTEEVQDQGPPEVPQNENNRV